MALDANASTRRGNASTSTVSWCEHDGVGDVPDLDWTG